MGDDDPYIKPVRVAREPARTSCASSSTCKTEVKPSVFPLAPAGEYKHRLVLDIYPAKPTDPLLALLQPQTDPIGEMARGAACDEPRARRFAVGRPPSLRRCEVPVTEPPCAAAC